MDKRKKLFVVSDVHGHCTLLVEALEKKGFDDNNPTHLLVSLGDYFDRGDQNEEVLRFFERLKHKVLLRGNHEDMLLKLFMTGKVLPHNYINGTMKTLENFFGKYFIDPIDDTIDFSGKTSTVDRICEFISDTVNYFETKSYVFVHGRTSNSKDVWGINNNIPSGQNKHFNSDINALSLNGMKYTNVNSQTLGSFEPNKGSSDTDYPCNLGNELLSAGYKKNINLFAFNYPNEDAVKYSAHMILQE